MVCANCALSNLYHAKQVAARLQPEQALPHCLSMSTASGGAATAGQDVAGGAASLAALPAACRVHA